MTEETTPIKEKEEKRKIKVISKIDDLIAIQGQSYMKGQLKEALDLADQIMTLAETENLTSFIREQEDLIARIKGLLKQREEKKQEKIHAELDSELKKLEVSYNSAFKSEDFLKIKQILIDANKFLLQHNGEKTKIKWKNFEKKYLDAEAKKEIIEDIKNLIKDNSEMKKNFLFEDLKLKIAYLTQQIQEKGLDEYLDKLKEIKSDVYAAEDAYNETNKEIDELKEKIVILRDNDEFGKALTLCESIIQLANSVDRIKITEEYSEVLLQLKTDLEHKKLTESINKLNNDGLELLKKGEISASLKNFEQIQNLLKQFDK
ncbi:MAG: hypothetical protein ACXABO_05855 [Promethearchaeota archaeon]|jgi:hypothetical protein